MDERRTAPQTVAAARAGISVATARRIEREPRPPSERREPRHWRTREDPLALVWESFIVPLLQRAPGLKPVTVLHELDRAFPGAYGERIRRTLERRMRDWRAVNGPERAVMFPQTHAPGRLGLSDFTHAGDLGVSIGGAPLDHLLYHFALAFSGFESAEVVLGGESFTALASGLQNALATLGGAPVEHRTDSLSAAFRNLTPDAAEDITRRYAALCGHYGMIASRNNRGLAHENGAIESRHAHIKSRLDQALLLRGNRDFESLDAYRTFVAEVVAEHNARRRREIELECAALRPLPPGRAPDYVEASVVVTTSGGFSFRRVFYTVPSRLVGRRLRLRVHEDRLEAYLGGTHLLTLPRRRASPDGRRSHVVDYRHVLHALRAKPGALIGLSYRDALWPCPAFARAWDALIVRGPERQACRTMVGLLVLAHEGGCETALAAALESTLDAGRLPDLEELRRRFAPSRAETPSVQVALPPPAAYDALLPELAR
jgi:hypothetical protein